MDADGEIARRFVAARRAAGALPHYPGKRPESLDAAYAIQDAAIALDARPLAGWKVGRVPAPHQARLGTDRLAGPIFGDQVRTPVQAETRMQVIGGGFGAVEAEFLLRIGRAPDPGHGPLSLADAAGLVDAVHVGLEIASSPYPGINADGPLVTISDFGNHNGLLVGPEIPDWRGQAFLDWTVETEVEGEVVGRAVARDMLDGPFGAVAFLANSLAARGRALAPGIWVSSGAVTGVHEIAPGARVTARFGGDFTVSCTIEAAQAVEGMMEADGGAHV